jgi:hypothetical protein
MDIQSPLIMIGAGRSGSTLLTRIFGAHSALDFRGETSFLVARLWAESWGDRFWFNWAHDAASHQRRSACEPMPPVPAHVLEQTRDRVGRCLAEYVVGLLEINRQRGCWGYKEIWNGAPSFRYDWSPYDAVFPGAWWLHQVRNPFEFARSCANWNQVPLTLDQLKHGLSDWCDMLRFNRARAATGRYFEVRHEDVMADAAGTVGPILRALGLEWQAACAAVLGQRHMQSRRPAPRSNKTAVLAGKPLANLVAGIPALSPLMAELRYTPPASVELEPALPEGGAAIVNFRVPSGEAAINPPPRHFLEQEVGRLTGINQELHKRISIRRWLRRRFGLPQLATGAPGQKAA